MSQIFFVNTMRACLCCDQVILEGTGAGGGGVIQMQDPQISWLSVDKRIIIPNGYSWLGEPLKCTEIPLK